MGTFRAIVALIAAVSIHPGTAPARQGDTPHSAAQAVTESISYLPAADQNIRITVNGLTTYGDRDFIPRSRNWIQVNITISNLSRRTVRVDSIQGRLDNGALFATSRSYDDITRDPGLNLGGIAAESAAEGLEYFPPVWFAARVGNAIASIFGARRTINRAQRYQESVLVFGPLAPGSNITGTIFIPALRNQTDFIVFYIIGGNEESLSVRRQLSH